MRETVLTIAAEAVDRSGDVRGTVVTSFVEIVRQNTDERSTSCDLEDLTG